MNIRFHCNFVAITFLLLMATASAVWVSESYASTCSLSGPAKWACGRTVYYSLSGFDDIQTSKIVAAIALWNGLPHSTRVTYAPADGSNSANHVFTAGTTSSVYPNDAARATWNPGTGIITSATTVFYFSNTIPGGAPIWDPTNDADYKDFLVKATLHEIGHTMGLADAEIEGLGESVICDQDDEYTIMNVGCGTNDQIDNMPTWITDCDKAKLLTICPLPTPTPTPTPTPVNFCGVTENWGSFPTTGCANGFINTAGTCGRSEYFIDWCEYDLTGYNEEVCDCSIPYTGGCQVLGAGCPYDGQWFSNTCNCVQSPIVIDVDGDGFDLTNSTSGVNFDLDNDDVGEKLSWTSTGSDDVWLALDRNGNGQIENGTELFGNVTPQPDPPGNEKRNGFLALAEYDKTGNGGNSDNRITVQDAIFGSLRLWQDSNHNGISESSELNTMNQMGLKEIDLKYKESKKTDDNGNQFRYRAKVKDIHGAQVGRWAWDVFLMSQPH